MAAEHLLKDQSERRIGDRDTSGELRSEVIVGLVAVFVGDVELSD